MEEWRDITKRPGYKISSSGLVMSPKGKILSALNHSRGYKDINLGRGSRHLIHRLVAEYFIENPNGYTEVDHIDRDKTNNSVSNLRWVPRWFNCFNTAGRGTMTGHKYISYSERDKLYVVQIQLDGKRFRKSFKDIDEAILYKSQILNFFGLEQ